MSALLTSTGWSVSQVEAWQQQLWRLRQQGACWHQQWPQRALQYFTQSGLPTRQHERWKYTSLTPLTELSLQLSSPLSLVAIRALEIDWSAYRLSADAIRLILVNGYFVPELSDLASIPSGLYVHSVSQWCQQSSVEPALFSALFTDVQNMPAHAEAHHAADAAFPLLNAALLTDGVHVHVAAGAKIQPLIHLLHVQVADAPIMSHTRHYVQMDAHSEVSLVEDYVGLQADGTYLQNAVTSMTVAEGAKLHHYKWQRESNQAFHFAHTAIKQQRDSQAILAYLGRGGGLSREDLQISLQQPGASCQLQGLYLSGAAQHMAHYSHIEHQAAHTTSQQHYRGVIASRGQAVFNGKIKVYPQAIKTQAQQENHNMVLAADAVINTKPELEIYVDDVSCKHGATIGQLDEQALFYLRTRGLDVNTAQSLLMQGFAEQVLSNVEHAVMAEGWHAHLIAWLEQVSH